MKKVFVLVLVSFCVFSGFAQTFKAVQFTSIKSSSTLSDKYKADNIASSDWKCWVEGKKGSGEGEWIEVVFSEPTSIKTVSFKNGFGNLSYFWKNNRIKGCDLIFDDDFSHPVKLTLQDTPQCQEKYLNLKDKTYSKMRLVIKSVYKGTDTDDDTCLDEIAVNMSFMRDSQMEWDVIYSTDAKSYVYDPETARMMKELYIMDVGAANVGTTKDGRITVKAQDWESGTPYTTVISGALTGTLFHGFWPGTGGGHQYHKYQILLNENGNHILAEWLDYGDGIVAKHSLDGLYIWKDKKWVSYKESSINPSDYGIENLVELINWLEQKNIRWDFYVDSDEIIISPRIVEAYGGNYCYFKFKYDTKRIYDYTKEPVNLIVKGSAEELKKIQDWKKLLPDEYQRANMLVVASAFNSDSSMTSYLLESGYAVNEPFLKNEHYGQQTPLEACLYYENNTVLQTLLDNGASYSPQILMDAMDRRNLEEVEKYAGLINSFDEVLIHVKDIYSNEMYYGKKDKTGTLEYIKKLIVIFKNKGIDINAYASEKKGKVEYHSICGDAILTMDLDYIKTCIEAGCKIPDQIEAYGDPIPLEYAVHQYLYGNDNDPEVIERRKKEKPVIDYLISMGARLDAPIGIAEWYTALYEICSSDYWQQSKIDMMKFLIQKGCNVNKKGKNGRTPLATFIYHNLRYLDQDYQKQVLDILLENGAETGEELFQIEYTKDHFDKKLFDRLFPAMHDITYVSRTEKRTLLTFILDRYSINEASYYALKKILSHDFNMYSKASEETFNRKTQTPFIEFVEHAMNSRFEPEKIFELYDLLLKHGANVNEKTSWNRTAFSEVMENLCDDNLDFGLKLLKKLINDGAKVEIKNREDELYLEVLFEGMYYVDEDEPNYIENNWEKLKPEQLDALIEISRILISNGTKISEKKMKKLHVPEDVIKRLLK